MGKKYILEIEENKDGDFAWSNFAPCIEPNLEQVRQKAYEKAYADAVYNCSEGCSHVEQVRQKAYKEGVEDGKRLCPAPEVCNDMAYQKGLSDAWDAARKIAHCALWADYRTDSGKLSVYTGDVLDYYTASEAIEKLKAYEQEEQIQVGDEVIAPFGKAIVVNIDTVAEKIWLVYTDGHGGFEYFKDAPRKTGRHFPEIAAVLEKMKE